MWKLFELEFQLVDLPLQLRDFWPNSMRLSLASSRRQPHNLFLSSCLA